MVKSEFLGEAVEMLQRHRWAAMATVDATGDPAASMVAYAVAPRQGVLYLHLSRLAGHTVQILQHSRTALVVSDTDDGSSDPQQLTRLALTGSCAEVGKDSPEYSSAKQCYLERLPDSARLFDFSDFILFRFEIDAARFVGGFGQAYSYRGDAIRQLLQQQ